MKTLRRPTWEQVEGSPLPLGATWIEEEQAFNFAVHAEHAESVTLLLYAADLANPWLSYRFDFLRNKSGRIWHCRIPLSELGEARYYAYSVSGEAPSYIHSFDPEKILLDPYATCVFFPPDFDRKLAMREGSNAGEAPLAMLPAPRPMFDWQGSQYSRHEADLSNDSHSLAFCLHGASQEDNDIYAIINAYWKKLEFQVQEGTAQEWVRIVDTALPSPDDFSDHGEPLHALHYSVASRSVVVLLRTRNSRSEVLKEWSAKAL